MDGQMTASLIAPCGMNCALCIAHQREKRRCGGCNGADETKPAHCAKCVIKHCTKLRKGASGFCFGCEAFACRRLKQLDNRYRTNYGMSMIENLDFIKQRGMDSFLLSEAEKWTCKTCGSVICVHRDACLYCKSR